MRRSRRPSGHCITPRLCFVSDDRQLNALQDAISDVAVMEAGTAKDAALIAACNTLDEISKDSIATVFDALLALIAPHAAEQDGAVIVALASQLRLVPHAGRETAFKQLLAHSLECWNAQVREDLQCTLAEAPFLCREREERVATLTLLCNALMRLPQPKMATAIAALCANLRRSAAVTVLEQDPAVQELAEKMEKKLLSEILSACSSGLTVHAKFCSDALAEVGALRVCIVDDNTRATAFTRCLIFFLNGPHRKKSLVALAQSLRHAPPEIAVELHALLIDLLSPEDKVEHWEALCLIETELASLPLPQVLRDACAHLQELAIPRSPDSLRILLDWFQLASRDVAFELDQGFLESLFVAILALPETAQTQLRPQAIGALVELLKRGKVHHATALKLIELARDAFPELPYSLVSWRIGTEAEIVLTSPELVDDLLNHIVKQVEPAQAAKLLTDAYARTSRGEPGFDILVRLGIGMLELANREGVPTQTAIEMSSTAATLFCLHFGQAHEHEALTSALLALDLPLKLHALRIVLDFLHREVEVPERLLRQMVHALHGQDARLVSPVEWGGCLITVARLHRAGHADAVKRELLNLLIGNVESLVIDRPDASFITSVFHALEPLAKAIHMKNLPQQFFQTLATSFYPCAQESIYEGLTWALAMEEGQWTPADFAKIFSIYVERVKHSSDKYSAIVGFLRFLQAKTSNRDWTFARKLELTKLLDKVRKFAKSCLKNETLTEPAYWLLKKRISEMRRPFSFLGLVVPH